MKLEISRVKVYAASIRDKPGTLAKKLAAIAEAGANLGFVIARRTPEKRSGGVVFITPLQGAAQHRAAKKLKEVISEEAYEERQRRRYEF